MPIFGQPSFWRPHVPALQPVRMSDPQWINYLDTMQAKLGRRLEDDPRLVGLVDRSRLEPDDLDLRELVQMNFDNLRSLAGSRPTPFYFTCPPANAIASGPGKIALGKLTTGAQYLFDVFCALLNVLVWGSAGSGKSTVCRRLTEWMPGLGFCVIAFVRDTEILMLESRPSLYGRLVKLELPDLKFVLFPVIPGVAQEVIDIAVINLIARCTGRVYAQRLLLEVIAILRQTYPGRGIDFDVLINALRHSRSHGPRSNDLLESMILALMSLRASLGSVFSFQESDMLARMTSSSVMFPIVLPNLAPEASVFLMSYCAWLLYESRIRRLDADHRPVFLLFDDATMLIDRRMDDQSIGGTSPITEMAVLGRKTKIGMGFATHSLSSCSPKLVSNSHLRIATSVVGEDERILRQAMSLTPEQIEYMQHELRPGLCVAHCPSVDGHPQLLEVEPD